MGSELYLSSLFSFFTVVSITYDMHTSFSIRFLKVNLIVDTLEDVWPKKCLKSHRGANSSSTNLDIKGNLKKTFSQRYGKKKQMSVRKPEGASGGKI